jgi:glucose-6-phosphate 1-dehydrogenase
LADEIGFVDDLAVKGASGGVHRYARGSWGPKEADNLLPDGASWRDPAD